LQPEPQLDTLSDLQLLRLLCTSDEDDELYKQFVRRFLPDVKQECKKKCELQKLDKHIGETIAHEVFERVRQYKSFKNDKVRIKNEHRAVLAYLSSIAGHLFLDHFRNEKRKTDLHSTYFDDFREQAASIDPTRLKDIKDMSKLIFKKLNSKEQAVVLADLEHKRFGKYLPDEVTLALSQDLAIKPASVRKIRERAKLKINKLLQAINEA
jgi:DNA-directed RNA polymerase specialized sigma24 family protein